MTAEDHGHKRQVKGIDQTGLDEKIEDSRSTFTMEVPPALGFGEGENPRTQIRRLVFRDPVPVNISAGSPALLPGRQDEMQRPGGSGKDRVVRGERATRTHHHPDGELGSPGLEPLVPPFAGRTETEGHPIGDERRLPDKDGIGLRPQGEEPPMILRRTKTGTARPACGNFPIGGKGEVGGDPESHALL